MPPAPPGAAVAARPEDNLATVALILGILGVLCFPILGPVALFIGNGSRRRIRESGGTLGGEGKATAGFVLGIIGTVFLALAVLLVLLGIVRSMG